MTQLGKGTACLADVEGFDSPIGRHFSGGLAHLGERLPCKQEVTSSILVSSTTNFMGVAQRPELRSPKPRAGGSNPSTHAKLWRLQ
jgi:hypothetical protein